MYILIPVLLSAVPNPGEELEMTSLNSLLVDPTVARSSETLLTEYVSLSPIIWALVPEAKKRTPLTRLAEADPAEV